MAEELSILDELWVHYAPTPDFRDAEKQMLSAFADAVSPTSRDALPDRERVMPFANLRSFDDLTKHHITGATGDLWMQQGAHAVGSPAMTAVCGIHAHRF